MNIFKSLSQGNGTISETNITSFLSYLLNSTNELDNSFLILFFDLIDSNLSQNKISDLLGLKQNTLRERIMTFSKKYSVLATPEFGVQKDGSKQYIDVFLKVLTKKDETDIAYILIENKIKVFSANKEQVSKQFEYFKQTTEYGNNLPIYSLLLTTDFDSFSAMNTNAMNANINSAWLKWTNRTHKENSIESILRNLLILEQHAEIQPINPNSQYILKSFIDYIVTEFSNYSTDQRNFSFNGSEEVEKAEVLLDNLRYILKRYDNKMIRIFDVNGNLLDIDVLPFLRKINDYYNLGVDSKHPLGTPKNTQVFGKDIMYALNNSKSLDSITGVEPQPSNLLKGQRSFEFNDSDEVEVASVAIDNNSYILKRYGNKMIRISDENNSIKDIPVLPLLRKINDEYHLGVSLNHPTGTPKNTQVFGKDIISKLNKQLMDQATISECETSLNN